MNDLAIMRPIVGIENRTPQEVFEIMCDRYTSSRNTLRECLKLLDGVEVGPKPDEALSQLREIMEEMYVPS